MCFTKAPKNASRDIMDSKPFSDSVFIEGYYIRVLTKKEINEQAKNRERRLQSKSIVVPYETLGISSFVRKTEIEKKGLYSVVENFSKRTRTEAFIECDKYNAESISEAFGIEKAKLLTCEWPRLSSGDSYYTTNRKSNYCFKIYSLSGWFLKLRVDTDDKRNAVTNKQLKLIPLNKTEFDMYYFMHAKSYSSLPSELRDSIRLWKEVKPIF